MKQALKLSGDLEDTRKWCFELQNTQKRIVETLAKHDKEFENLIEFQGGFDEFKREMLGYVKQIRIIVKHMKIVEPES